MYEMFGRASRRALTMTVRLGEGSKLGRSGVCRTTICHATAVAAAQTRRTYLFHCLAIFTIRNVRRTDSPPPALGIAHSMMETMTMVMSKLL